MSIGFSTVLFGVAIVYRGRPWVRTVFLVVFISMGITAVVGTAMSVRRAHRERAIAPLSPRDVELRELDEQIDRLRQAEPELRSLVARRNAGEISEEEFARLRDEILVPEEPETQ